jgi:N-acetylmuramoyl-L-alanine amidase
MIPKYITIHSTGNPSSTARNERGWLTNPSNTRTASWHIAVDEKEAVEAIPLTEVAWHAGDGSGQGNRASIGIEICESGNREKTLRNAVQLVAKLLKEKGWGVDRLRRHHDWSGKICPRILQPNNWQGWKDFIKAVEKELNSVAQKTNIPSAWAKKPGIGRRRKGC